MKVITEFDLTAYNSYRVKATCKRAFLPEKEEDFIEIYQSNPTEKEKVILGGGYNVILSQTYYENDFVLIGTSFSSVTVSKDGLIVAEAGLDVKLLSELALAHGLTGLEIFYDIPSSLGGAVVMNAGAGGEDIKDVLVKVRYLDLLDYKIKEKSREELGFAYRNSFFQQNPDKIILKAWLRLASGDPDHIRKKMEDTKAARWAKQPKDFPNAGSVFKRPQGHYVGPMIEELGLKGYAVGGAKVSEKHGGFIVNFNQAKGEDILQLVKEIQAKVKQKFGVDLEIEQRII